MHALAHTRCTRARPCHTERPSGHARLAGEELGGDGPTCARTYFYAAPTDKVIGAAHLGVDEEELERSEDDDGGDAVAGDEDGPRRTSTLRERIRAP